MAHTLFVKEEGLTALSLTTVNWVLRGYTPVEAEAVDIGEGADSANSDLIGDVLYRRVTETIELYCYAASKTALQTAYRALQTLMLNAQKRQRRGVGNRVFLQLQIDGEADLWQSEIITGRLELAADALPLWSNIGMNVRLFITRRAYFEGVNEVAVSMTSTATASTTTAGVTITNTVDTNWCGIASNQITGSLPTPLRIEVKHVGANGSYSKIHILNNASISPTTYDAWRTGAESTGGSGVISTSDPSGDSPLLRWVLPTAMLDLLQGAYVRVLVALTSMPTTAQFRGFIETNIVGDYNPRYRGALVDGDSAVVDLGLFPLPPGGFSTGYDGVEFGVGIRYDGALSATIHHLLFVPTDGERRMVSGYYVFEADDFFMDDPYTRSFYAYGDSTGDKYASGAGQGGPLWAYPGVVNRLYVLSAGLFSYAPARQNKVCAWFRPRRLTI